MMPSRNLHMAELAVANNSDLDTLVDELYGDESEGNTLDLDMDVSYAQVCRIQVCLTVADTGTEND